MKHIHARAAALAALGLAALVSGCDDSDSTPATRNITLQFAAQAGTNTIGCDTAATGMGVAVDKTLAIKDFRFYVSGVELITASGTRVPVTLANNSWQRQAGSQNVALLDFTNKDSGCSGAAKAGNSVVTGTVPAGNYTGVEFELGVPAPLNHTNAATEPAPLDVLAMSWPWQAGRKFVKLESSWDNGGTPVNQVFHLGSTGCTGFDGSHPETVTCTSPYRPTVTLSGFDADSNVIVADYRTLLASTDLATGFACMPGSSALCQEITRIAGADTSGVSNGTQSFFRVE